MLSFYLEIVGTQPFSLAKDADVYGQTSGSWDKVR